MLLGTGIDELSGVRFGSPPFERCIQRSQRGAHDHLDAVAWRSCMYGRRSGDDPEPGNAASLSISSSVIPSAK